MMKLQAVCASPFYAFATEASGKNDFEQGQCEQSVPGRHQVVGHHAEAVLDVLVEVTRGLRLGDVEKAEEHEGGELPEEGLRRHQQDQPERHDFIPDDTDVGG